MSGSWTISVAGRTYGPYSDKQMQDFAAEGRLAPQSLVAREGEKEFRPAADESELAAILSLLLPTGMRAVAPAPRGDEAASFGRSDDQPQNGERSHLVIIADMKSGSISKLEEEIATLGRAYAVLPQVWLLTSEISVNTVRNLLVQQLGKLDMLLVVDASSDKAAWFNFGPEADARIRKMWRAEPKLRAAS